MPRPKGLGQKIIDITLLGDVEASKTLNRLAIAAQRKILKAAMRDAFKITLADAKRRVPPQMKTVKRRLKLRLDKRTRGGVGMRIFTPGRDELSIRPIRRPGSRGGHKKPGFYPMSWETQRGTSGSRHGVSFMRDALKTTRDRVLERMRSRIRAALEMEARS